MGFLNFLKRGDGNKQKLTPPTNPDSSLSNPTIDGSAIKESLTSKSIPGKSIPGEYSRSEFNPGESITTTDIKTDIPKPPVSDDYDMIHSDDDDNVFDSGSSLSSDLSSPSLSSDSNSSSLSSSSTSNSQFPTDDFGGSIQNKESQQEFKESSSEIQQQSMNEGMTGGITGETIEKTTKESSKKYYDAKEEDIDDDLPDFTDEDVHEAEELEKEEQVINDAEQESKKLNTLPVFSDADELSDSEINSFVKESTSSVPDLQKDFFVSANNYESIVSLIKGLKKSNKGIDSSLKSFSETIMVEKESYDKLTTTLKSMQENLLMIDNKFLKR